MRNAFLFHPVTVFHRKQILEKFRLFVGKIRKGIKGRNWTENSEVSEMVKRFKIHHDGLGLRKIGPQNREQMKAMSVYISPINNVFVAQP